MAFAAEFVYVFPVIEKVKDSHNEPNGPASTDNGVKPLRESTLGTRKWFESLEYVLEYALRGQGAGQATFFMDNLMERLRESGVQVSPTTHTPYINTIPVEKEPAYPGDWQIETRI
ncbi:MAG TPA: hypothetical protein VGE41_04130, partial [Verrucomicrobiae bacterium]